MENTDKELLESLKEGDVSSVLDLSKDIFVTKFEPLKEEASSVGKGVLARISGVLMGPFGVENGNGRDYTKEVPIKGILESEYVKRQLKYKTLLGEPHHPDNRYEIWSNEVSHSIVEMHMSDDEKYLMGSVDILDTPSGKVLKTLVDYGCILGVSARATGKTRKQNGRLVVVPEAYNFRTFDIVLNPGFEEARLTPVNEELTTDQDVNVTRLVEELIKSGTESAIATAKSVIEYCGDETMKAMLPKVDEGKTDNSAEESYLRDIEDLEEEIESLCKERSQYKTEVKRLKLQVNALQEKLRESAIARGTSDSEEMLKRALSCRDLSIKQLREDNRGLKSGLNEAVEVVESLIARLNESRRSNERMSGEIEALRESLDETSANLKEKVESKNVGLSSLVESKADMNVVSNEVNNRVKGLIEKLGGRYNDTD